MKDKPKDRLAEELLNVRKRIAETEDPEGKERLVNEALRLRKQLADMERAEDERRNAAEGPGSREDIAERFLKMSRRISNMEKLEVDLKDTVEKLWKNGELFRTVISNVPAVVFALDRDGVFVSSGGKGLDALGLRSEKIIGQSAFEVYRNVPQILRDIRRALSGEAFISVVKVYDLWFEIRYEPIRDTGGQGVSVIGVAFDITRQKRAEEEQRVLSITDSLTGLLNRRGFYNLSPQQFRMADREKRGMLLLFADIDNLKRINDTLGHREGDNAIIESATQLKNTFRGSDIIARLDGDEFAVLMIERALTDGEDEIISRLKENLRTINLQENRRYELSLSIGMARYDYRHPCSLDELLARADLDMYEKKRSEQKS
jgi:diguanylate cyclase (GGDEF)-like protein/PAS domain S-box-containing protein